MTNKEFLELLGYRFELQEDNQVLVYTPISLVPTFSTNISLTSWYLEQWCIDEIVNLKQPKYIVLSKANDCWRIYALARTVLEASTMAYYNLYKKDIATKILEYDTLKVVESYE